MSNLIATKQSALLAPYLALDQGSKVQAECELDSLSLSFLGFESSRVESSAVVRGEAD